MVTDEEEFNKAQIESRDPQLSLVSKWIPRERSTDSWLFKKMAKTYNHHILSSTNNYNNNDTSNENIRERAKRKAYMNFRKLISKLNTHLDTTQIKMCNNDWSSINFNNVTSQTMQNQKRSFLNIKRNKEVRFDISDRRQCAENLKEYIQKSKTGDVIVKGKRCSLDQLVKDAQSVPSTDQDMIDIIKII